MAKIDPNVKKAVKVAYNLGILNERDRLKLRINCLEKTHRHLIDEIFRLDKLEPVDGIILSRKETLALIKKLRKFDRHSWWAKKLRSRVNKVDRELLKILKEYVTD